MVRWHFYIYIYIYTNLSRKIQALNYELGFNTLEGKGIIEYELDFNTLKEKE